MTLETWPTEAYQLLQATLDTPKLDQERLDTDFEYYAQHCLKIRTKSGEIKPFVFNDAQRYLHKQVEKQLAETGRVRINGLKGRQQGFSTYVEARFYWRTSRHRGIKAFILTHEAEATKNLFEMAERYHNNCPEDERPQLKASNAKELDFADMDSGYRVGTAGNKETGRSSTIQLFHASEVAFWPNASRIAKGALQAVPDEMGTEIYRESTSDGKGNYFFEQWEIAEGGASQFQNVFIPWFWQQEYRAPLRQGFAKTAKEIAIARTYGLDDEQMQWRRNKIADLTAEGKRGEDEFKREYPNTPEEAFIGASDDTAFEKLSRDLHMIRTFSVPQHWARFTVIDWGTSKPFSVGWYTIPDEDFILAAKGDWPERLIPKGALIRYRELYGWAGRPNVGCRKESPEVARTILEIEEEGAEDVDFRVGDSAMWAKHDGPSVQERMYDATDGRYVMEQSRKDREANYQEVRVRIEGNDGLPMLYVTENCKHWWRTVPYLKLDELHPNKGPDTEEEDHAYDDTQYACAARPMAISQKERHDAAWKDAKRKVRKKASPY